MTPVFKLAMMIRDQKIDDEIPTTLRSKMQGSIEYAKVGSSLGELK